MSDASVTAVDPERQNTTTAAGIDRNTSVRSVMTLPAYSPAVRENERVLAREGERGGIDTVIEFPETDDQAEERREDEMASLYQIRLARRIEAREREERRQARREARLRGDYAELAAIRRRAEEAQENQVSQLLIATHQVANRDRRVSSVQYGDLGVARHDGTRIRANSSESNRPLLDSSVSISGMSERTLGYADSASQSHNRGLSASSILSADSRASDEFDFPEATRARSRETNDDFGVVSLTQTRSRSASVAPPSLPLINVPHEDAPAYEDPPNYESPVSTRAPEVLPTVHVTAGITHTKPQNRSTSSA